MGTSLDTKKRISSCAVQEVRRKTKGTQKEEKSAYKKMREVYGYEKAHKTFPH